MTTSALTDRQQEVLNFIQHCRELGGASPSLREIAGHFGFRSMKAAADHVTALRRKGALTGPAGRARSLSVVHPLQSLRRPIVNIPLLGSIPAGFPQDREQEADGCISVDIETLGIHPSARTFALQVRGDSMIGRHILDRDVVIQAVRIAFDQLALRPRFPAVAGNGRDQRIAFARREWELAGVIVVEREQIGAARQALDARGTGG